MFRYVRKYKSRLNFHINPKTILILTDTMVVENVIQPGSRVDVGQIVSTFTLLKIVCLVDLN